MTHYVYNWMSFSQSTEDISLLVHRKPKMRQLSRSSSETALSSHWVPHSFAEEQTECESLLCYLLHFLTSLYTQYIKKRNWYIFADNLSNFKDVHFKLAGFIDYYVCHSLAEFHNFSGTIAICCFFFEQGYP